MGRKNFIDIPICTTHRRPLIIDAFTHCEQKPKTTITINIDLAFETAHGPCTEEEKNKFYQVIY
jgi:hypothetical protein